jgi:hypothetical protein
MFSPVALFVYNRPIHTQNLLNSLVSNKEAIQTTLYVFCDGLKPSDSIEEIDNIMKVREIIKTEKRFKKIVLKINNENLGLANSIINGVSSVLEKHDSIIVLEDDLIVSPYFLTFMNESLNKYRDNLKVGQIGACNFFACGKKYPETFFLHIPDCWGWATWKNRWDLFNEDAVELLKLLKLNNEMLIKFNASGAYDFQQMLQNQIENKVNSWAIRWQATCVLNDLLTLYPNPSLTNHIASIKATHANINVSPPLAKIKIKYFENEIHVRKDIIKAMKRGYSNSGNYYGKLKVEYFLKIFQLHLIYKPISFLKYIVKWIFSSN